MEKNENMNNMSLTLIVMSTKSVEDVVHAFDALFAFSPQWIEAPFAFEIELTNQSAKQEAEYQLSCIMKGDTPLDIALLPSHNRHKKLFISDMDSTLIHQECIDETADALGLKKQVALITEKAMRGEIDFHKALHERVALLKGLSETALLEIWQDKISIMEGAKPCLQRMKQNGATTILVSGGFTFFAEKVAKILGFDYYYANELVIEKGVLTGEVKEPILGQEAKLDYLKQHINALGITQHDAIAIGDGANDLKMIGHAGMGIAYQAKPAVRHEAAFQLNHTDLRGVLYLQGYGQQ